MPADDAALLELADAVLEGRAIEWGNASVSLSDDMRALVPHFQAVADIAAFARSSSLLGRTSSTSRAPREWLPPQSTWGPLTIVEPIGHGSFGDVYRAVDPRLDRPVALKLLRRRDRSQSSDSAVVDEARLMARVRHPNVVTVFGAERLEGRVGLWMEYVDGRSLEDELKVRGPLPQSELIAIGIDLCRALAAIHRAGLLHRDLKAQNVLRDSEGRVLVTDFGAGLELAELDEADRTLAGTPLYLAPEVLAGAQASQQSDIYSLGVLLFHLATASYPVTGRTLDAVRSAHADRRRNQLLELTPGLDRRLAGVIDRALAPTPAERFRSAGEMQSALEASIHPAAAPANSRRAGAVITMASLLLIAAGGLLGSWLWQARASRVEPVPLAPRRILMPAGQIFMPSPDLRAMAYLDTNERAQIWDLERGQQRSLTRESSAATDIETVVAPDGQRIAVASRLPDGSFELRVLHTGPTVPRPLIARQSGFVPVPLDWSAGGDEVLCWLRQKSGPTDLVLVPVSGGSPRVVHTFSGIEPVSAKLSPDGRYIAASLVRPDERRTELVLLATDGGVPRLLVERIAPGTTPTWTPDGSRVFYLVESTDKPGSRDGWHIPVDRGQPAGTATIAARDLGHVWWAQLAPNGVMARLIWNTSAEVYTRSVDLAGHEPAGPPSRVVPEQIGGHAAPSWSPDGARLGYFTTRPAAAVGGTPVKTLTITDMAKGARREIATPLFWLGGYAPRWMPDGRRVIVWGSDADREERYGFYEVDLSTGNATAVLLGSEISPVADLSPDGRILYYRRADGPLLARDLASGLERAALAAAGEVGSFRVGRDGRSLAYTRWVAADETTALMVQAADRSVRELLRVHLPEFLRVHAWTPDGSGIIYTRATADQPHRLWLVPVRGGTSTDLGATFIRSGNNEPNGFDLRPDGRVLAYPERVVQSELWLTPLTGRGAGQTEEGALTP